MKIIRSSKCSLKFASKSKLRILRTILEEYSRVVNFFINIFWDDLPPKSSILKGVINLPKTWLSFRLKKLAAIEAIGMIKASKGRWGSKAKKPTRRKNRMSASCSVASLRNSRNASEFDCWLHLSSIGNNIIIDLPIKKHRQFLKWESLGKRYTSYTICEDYIQFFFEIDTGAKKKEGEIIGIDTGINSLASLSTGEQIGSDIKNCVKRINGCKYGSNGQKKARRALRQRIDEISKQITVRDSLRMIVVEKLKNLNYKTKERRRLSKNIRRAIGSWPWRYWLDRLQMGCEENRVSFRSVPAYNTSIICPACGHADRGNRKSQEYFQCQKCGHAGNADIVAARNILNRFLTGPYGACCKPNDVTSMVADPRDGAA